MSRLIQFVCNVGQITHIFAVVIGLSFKLIWCFDEYRSFWRIISWCLRSLLNCVVTSVTWATMQILIKTKTWSLLLFFFSFADNSCNLYITFQQKVALYINHWFAIACRQLVRLQTYVSCNVLCKGKIEYRKGCPDIFTWKGSMALSPCGSYLYDYLLTLKRNKCLA